MSMGNRNLIMLWVCLVVSSPALAFAQSPALLPVQGYLTDAEGAPLQGPHTIRATLYDKSFSGAQVFSETSSGVMVEDGAFVLYVGNVGLPAFDLGLFATHDQLWLELSVDNDVIEPRFRLGSVPYAAYAAICGDAETVGGTAVADLAAADHSHAFADLSGVPASLADGTDDDALSGLSCTTGQIASFNGTNWVCSTLSATSLTTGTLPTAQYSAYADLQAENYLNGDAGDLVTYGAGDSRYVLAAGAADPRYMAADRFASIAMFTVTATQSSTSTTMANGKTFCALTRAKQTGSAGECSITQSGASFTLSATAGNNPATCAMSCF
jgi:hypothetical protein